MSHTKTFYNDVLISDIALRASCPRLTELPSIRKIVINMALTNLSQDKKKLLYALTMLSLLTGQRGVVTRARKSIAAFKLKQGSPTGCKVTLTGPLMFMFLERLVWVILPSLKDFNGFSIKTLSNPQSYSIGLDSMNTFPEIRALSEKLQSKFGMDITIVLKSGNIASTMSLLSSLGLPYRRS